MSVEFSKESLSKSEKAVKQLYPVLVNQEGKVLDGNHRLASNPEWKKEVVETKNRAEEILVRIHAHHRRRVSQEETKALLVELAKELQKTDIKKEDISTEVAKITPYSQRWVELLLPSEFKKAEKVKAGKLGAEVIRQKMLAELVECARCHMSDRECKEYKGEILCPKCLEKARYKPTKEAPPSQPPKVTTYKEKWEHRRARMSPGVSKMEEAVLVKLEEEGLHPEVQKEFCLRSTRPDYYFPKQNLAIYLDGPVHKGREDRDTAVRELLQRRTGVKPVGIAYSGTSQAELDEIVIRIREVTEQRSRQK